MDEVACASEHCPLMHVLRLGFLWTFSPGDYVANWRL